MCVYIKCVSTSGCMSQGVLLNISDPSDPTHTCIYALTIQNTHSRPLETCIQALSENGLAKKNPIGGGNQQLCRIHCHNTKTDADLKTDH